jgi:type I restriction enzyme, S subunit
MSDELTELTQGWTWVNLSQLGKLINGDRGKNYPNKEAFVEVGIPFINAGHLEDGIIQFFKMNYITEERFKLLGSGKVQPNDILYCLRGSLGKTAIVRDISQGAIASSLVIIRLFECTTPEYLFNFLISPLGKAEILKFDNGSAQPNLSAGSVGEYSVPLPPLNEQKRIVAQIEALRDRSHKAKAALDAIPELCDRFRQSVLASAFRGDLTADWREQNPDVEPASVLLERIRSDRRRRWELFELDRMMAENKLPKKDDWKKKYSDIDLVEKDIEISIPDSWTLLPLSSVTDVLRPISYGILKPGDYFEDGVPMLRIVDIKNGEINFSNVHKVSEKLSQEYKRTLLYGGEVVISLVGTIGLVAEIPKVISKVNIHRNLGLIPPSQFISSKFLIYWLKSPYVREYLLSVTTGANQPLLNLADVRSLPIPVPPINEQNVLVERLETQLATLNRVDQALSWCTKYLNTLNQSVLSKAFRGELVDQDPNDEPASVLLDRIRAEREAQQPTPKRQRKGTGRQKSTQQGQIDLPLE